MTTDKFDLYLQAWGVLSAVMLPLWVWLIKSMLKISQCLFGVNGNNGVHGRTRDLEEKTDYAAGVLRDQQGDISRLKEETALHRRRYHDEFVPAINEQARAMLGLEETQGRLATSLDRLAVVMERKP